LLQLLSVLLPFYELSGSTPYKPQFENSEYAHDGDVFPVENLGFGEKNSRGVGERRENLGK